MIYLLVNTFCISRLTALIYFLSGLIGFIVNQKVKKMKKLLKNLNVINQNAGGIDIGTGLIFVSVAGGCISNCRS